MNGCYNYLYIFVYIFFLQYDVNAHYIFLLSTGFSGFCTLSGSSQNVNMLINGNKKNLKMLPHLFQNNVSLVLLFNTSHLLGINYAHVILNSNNVQLQIPFSSVWHHWSMYRHQWNFLKLTLHTNFSEENPV